MSDTTIFAVMPILPAASSLLGIVLASCIGLLTAVASFRLRAMRTFFRVLLRQIPAVIVLVLVTAIAISGLRRIGTSGLTYVRTDSEAKGWPVFRGTVARTGHADQQAGPNQGGIRWTAGRDYEFYSSPAVVGNQIIAVGSKGDSARFFCWNAATGEQIWSFAYPGYRATFSSPVIDHGHLFCGEGLHQTPDSRLMSFQLQDSAIPKLSGQFSTRSHVECTPAVVDGRIYFGAGDDGIYCLELPNDSTPNLKIVWHAEGRDYPDAETALAVYQGRVFVGLGHQGEALCVLDAATGKELQRVSLPYPCFSPPAIEDGRLYLGMGRADYSNFRDPAPGEVRCLDLQTLETHWSVSTPAAVLTSIVAHHGNAVFSTVDGQLYVVDRHGRVTHRWNAHAPVLTAPVVTDQMVYCVACDGLLTGLNHQLDRVWSVRLGAAGDYISSPVVVQGHLYVGTPHDGMVCVGEAPVAGGDEETSNNGTIRSSIPTAVETVWTFSGQSSTESPDGIGDISAPPTVTSRDLFVPVSAPDTGTKKWNRLVCADLSESRPPQSRWVFDSPSRIEVPLCVFGEQVLCLSGTPGTSGKLTSLSRDSGAIVWQQLVPQVPRWFKLDGNCLLIPSESRMLTRLALQSDPRGHVEWTTETGRLDHPVEVQGEIIIAAASDPAQLTAIDRISGQVLWKVPLLNAPSSAPIVVKTQIFVATSQAIEIRSLLDGSLVQTLDEWSELTTMRVDGHRLIGTTSPGDLLIGTLGFPRPTRRLSGIRPNMPLLVGNDAVASVADERRIERVSLTADVPAETWYELNDVGRIQIAPVLFNDRVYVSVTGIGLVCLKARSTP